MGARIGDVASLLGRHGAGALELDQAERGGGPGCGWAGINRGVPAQALEGKDSVGQAGRPCVLGPLDVEQTAPLAAWGASRQTECWRAEIEGRGGFSGITCPHAGTNLGGVRAADRRSQNRAGQVGAGVIKRWWGSLARGAAGVQQDGRRLGRTGPAAGLHQRRLQHRLPPPTSTSPFPKPLPKSSTSPSPGSGRNPRRPDGGRLRPRPPPRLPSPYSRRPQYMALEFMIKIFHG